MIFDIETDTKKQFVCPECGKPRDILVWKSLGNSLNLSGNGYLCEKCWDTIDKDLEAAINDRLSKVDYITEEIKRKLKLRNV
jgi:predicted RNA-binding Zn-ribbon protein involved in translation (DUF1610 family)